MTREPAGPFACARGTHASGAGACCCCLCGVPCLCSGDAAVAALLCLGCVFVTWCRQRGSQRLPGRHPLWRYRVGTVRLVVMMTTMMMPAVQTRTHAMDSCRHACIAVECCRVSVCVMTPQPCSRHGEALHTCLSRLLLGYHTLAHGSMPASLHRHKTHARQITTVPCTYLGRCVHAVCSG